MTAITKTSAKSFFETGDKPTQAQFADLIDSCVFQAETTAQSIAGSLSVVGAVTVSGAFNSHNTGTLTTPTVIGGTFANGVYTSAVQDRPTINVPTVSAGTLNSPTINTPAVSAGTFASPALTGTPTAPTASAGNGSTQIATTAYVKTMASKAIGIFTRDISLASGSQAVTGVGFVPSMVEFQANVANMAAVSFGADNGTTHYYIRNIHDSVPDDWNNSSSFSIGIVTTAGNYDGVISAMDSDGFTISWTRTSTPVGTATIQYIAHR